MSENIPDLVAQITLAESRLTSLIDQQSQPSHTELLNLDKRLAEAFEALMAASPQNVPEHLERISFLVSYIRKLTDHTGLTERILDQIEKDVRSIADTWTSSI